MAAEPPERAERKTTRYDHLLKWSLTQAHDDFLAVLAPGLIWQAERSPEVPAIPRLADLVWEVERPTGGRGLLHIELQIKPEDDLGERLAEYAIRLWRRDHLPVRSLLVMLRRTAKTPTTPFVIPWDGEDISLRYAFTIIRLWEIPYQQALAANAYALWPLASLMAGASIETTVAVAEQLAVAPLPRQERSDLVGLLTDLAGIRLPIQALLEALRENTMIDDLLRESGVAEYFRQEALKEGKEAGMREGMRQMIIVALEGRFGELADDLRAAVNQADEATLEAVAAHITTETLDQLRERLGLL